MKTTLASRQATAGGTLRWLRKGVALGAVLAALIGVRTADAFYPLGGYDVNGVLRFAVWPLAEIDTNGDGDVRGEEGIPLIFESGAWGFNDSEINTVLSGYEEWESVATSFAAFRYSGKTSDDLELSGDLTEGSIDFLNYVAFEFSDEGTTDENILPDGTISLTLMSFAIDDTTVTVGGFTYPISGGQMIDVDTVLDGTAYRDPESVIPQLFSLRGTSVVASGYSLGMNASPLVNPAGIVFDPEDPEVPVGVTEDRVIALPDRFGNLRLVGTSSSMQANIALLYADDRTDSCEDLAPDDIAGISFLYPRANQANFANIEQRAQRRSRPGAPTDILEGAHIVAWCDTDDNPTTLRVPFVDTLTGLYEFNPATRGNFDLKGLFKQVYHIDGTLFEPTYVLSCAPFEPLDESDPSEYDSTHGGAFEDFPNPLQFDTLFSAEIFNEFGNILGLGNVEEGTPLRFDPARNRFVSVNTNQSLAQILAGTEPMFGSPHSICWYTVAAKGTAAAVVGPKILRDLRDRFLLNSAPGLLIADAYYHTTESITGYLLLHPTALTTVRTAVAGFNWLLLNPYAGLALLLAPLGFWLARRRARAARAVAATGLVLALALLGSTAYAQELPLTTKDLVELSDDIVTGTVQSVESRFSSKNRIETDVTVSVDDTVKGRLNKGGQVTFHTLGGRVGSIVTYSPQLARFTEGEAVLLFLKKNKSGTVTVTAGRRGKYLIETDPDTQERFVVKRGPAAPPEPAFGKAPKAAGSKERPVRPEPDSAKAESAEKPPATPAKPKLSVEERIPLDDYKAELRQLVLEEQEAAR